MLNLTENLTQSDGCGSLPLAPGSPPSFRLLDLFCCEGGAGMGYARLLPDACRRSL